MCFKAFRIPFRTKKQRPGSPAHQLDTRPSPSTNPPQLHSPDLRALATGEPRKPAETDLDPLQDVPSPGDDTNYRTATEDIPDPTLDWKTTTWNAAKLTLRLVKESADAFPPLKAVAGGLCEIISNFEVRPFSCKRRRN